MAAKRVNPRTADADELEAVALADLLRRLPGAPDREAGQMIRILLGVADRRREAEAGSEQDVMATIADLRARRQAQ